MQKDSKNQLPLRKLYELEGMSPPLLFRKKVKFGSYFYHILLSYYIVLLGFSGAPNGKESSFRAGDPVRRSPGEGKGNPLQYSCLENSMDRGAWWLESMGPQTSDMTESLTHVALLSIYLYYLSIIYIINISN